MALEIASRTNMHWREEKVFFDGKRFVYGLVTEEGKSGRSSPEASSV